ncbi:hypothetical protein PG994_000213 [Apiospora phragmitis]|uniref:C2H2-type domain-containing protein n=1 Tax=Apiospora phragmitis TaxID=2905665 RepID=A0ABR1X5L9_9PEZI
MAPIKFACGTCSRWFGSCGARKQHMKAPSHTASRFDCDTCDRSFPARQQVEDHMDSTDHWCDDYDDEESKSNDIYDDDFCMCGTCSLWFGSFESRDQHFDALNHAAPEFECNTCELFYATRREVDDHMNIENHWTYSDDGVTEEYPCRLSSCSSISTSEEDRNKHEAKEHAWNGSEYQCHLCHKKFGKFDSLNDHLGSTVHQQALHHCPNRTCRKGFTTLSAVMLHLESESCGFSRFANVQRAAT